MIGHTFEYSKILPQWDHRKIRIIKYPDREKTEPLDLNSVESCTFASNKNQLYAETVMLAI